MHAIRIRPGGAIDDMDLDRLLERHVPLGAGLHPGTERGLGIVELRRKEIICKLERILEPDAAVREGAPVAVEELARRRVVEVDRELVGKHELHPAQDRKSTRLNSSHVKI